MLTKGRAKRIQAAATQLLSNLTTIPGVTMVTIQPGLQNIPDVQVQFRTIKDLAEYAGRHDASLQVYDRHLIMTTSGCFTAFVFIHNIRFYAVERAETIRPYLTAAKNHVTQPVATPTTAG